MAEQEVKSDKMKFEFDLTEDQQKEIEDLIQMAKNTEGRFFFVANMLIQEKYSGLDLDAPRVEGKLFLGDDAEAVHKVIQPVINPKTAPIDEAAPSSEEHDRGFIHGFLVCCQILATMGHHSLVVTAIRESNMPEDDFISCQEEQGYLNDKMFALIDQAFN